MCRQFSIILMLLAQAIATMAPVGLIRCVAADGRECIEFAGQDCRCCVVLDLTESEETHDESRACCHHCDDVAGSQAGEDSQGKQVVSSPSTVRVSDCGCVHSPLEVDQSPTTNSQQSMLDSVTSWLVADVDCFNVDRCFEESGLRNIPSRPCGSPHLRMVATTVLRV